MSEELETASKLADEDSDRLFVLPRRYENRGIIGRGGMGTVFRSYDTNLGRDVAVKILQFEGSKDSVLQERFAREAKTLASLDHPNIVKLLSSGVNDLGDMFLIMEFLDGKPLSKLIGAGKRLTPMQFQEVFLQLLSGLDYAHRKGVVHRDLKPSNIILVQSNEGLCPKIIDFGIAYVENPETVNHGLTKTGNLLGSPNYMSPEQCKGERVGQRTDIYSLGCMMHEALLGKVPHEGNTQMEVMYKHTSQPAASLQALATDLNSRRLGKLIDRCLSKDPLQRPQSVADLLAEFDQISCRHLQTGRFFAQQDERFVDEKKIRPICAIGLCVLIFGAMLALIIKQNYESKRAAQYAFEKQEADKLKNQITSLKEKAEHFEVQFKIARKRHSSAEELEVASSSLKSSLMLLAKAQIRNGFPEDAETTLNKYLASFPCSEQDKAVVFIQFSKAKLQEKEYAVAEEYLQKADRCMFNHPNEHAEIYMLATMVHYAMHDFARANEDFQRLLTVKDTVRLNQEGMGARYPNAESRSLRVQMSLGLWHFFDKQPALQLRENERVEAIKLVTNVGALLIKEDSATTLSGGPMKQLQNWLKETPLTNDEAIQAAKRAYLVLASYEDMNEDQEKAVQFEKLAREIGNPSFKSGSPE